MHVSKVVAILACAIGTHAGPQERQVADPTVVISAGTIIGKATRLSNQPTNIGVANAYLGIPFAKKPVRFSPPQATSTFSAPIVAKTLPAICLQNNAVSDVGQKAKYFFNNPVLNGPLKESEDCLYLNVFTPRGVTSTSKKAVLFWLFGGNLASGGASLAGYNGSSYAINQDVVVVVPNYRTNIFGFSGSPQVNQNENNVGFLDQRFALQWVQDNIAQFGGDPQKVTLFGESAGGFSIKQLLAQPPSPLPFRAAILESQGASTGNSSASYQAVVAHFNCSTASSPIDCLRRVNATDIQNYLQSNSNLSFPPVVDSTNLDFRTNSAIDSGKFAQVPILIGTNDDEATIFLEIAGITPGFNGNINSTLLNYFGVDVSSITYPLSLLYNATVGASSYEFLNRFITDFVFTCRTNTFSDLVASKGRQPVWRYRYDPGFPNQVYGKPYLRAYHTEEIFSVWGTYPLQNQFGAATSTQIALSSYLQGVWANFAKNPAAGPGWPQLGSNNGVELGILGGENNTTGEQTVAKLTADYPCFIFNPINIATGNAY